MAKLHQIDRKMRNHNSMIDVMITITFNIFLGQFLHFSITPLHSKSKTNSYKSFYDSGFICLLLHYTHLMVP